MRFGGFFREHDLHSSPWAVRGYRAARRLGAAVGLDIVLKTFYSPIPAVAELPADTFERRSSLTGIAFDLDEQLGWVAERAPAMGEFQPAANGADPHAYAAGHVSYTLLDATLLYGVLRSLRPRRVVELGSGASTLVTAQAARANERDGAPLHLEVFDPFPSVVTDDLPGLGALRRTPAQAAPLEAFDALEAGDVLFVDTTHTVKLASDVNFVVLDVLPRLKPGVLVHVHDVFLPYEYPRQWVEDFALYWSEQYLLQAFLAQNPHWTIRCATHALVRSRGRKLLELLPDGVPAAEASSFWIERTG